jgi:hypothetical protein
VTSPATAEVLLSEEDLQHLQDKKYDFSVSQDAGFICVVIRNLELAGRYLPRATDLLVRLPSNFPMAKPDMFWTHPHVKLASGIYPPQADVFSLTHDGRQWQQWSRHLSDAQWRPGRDCLRTFLGTIRRELQEGV